MDYKAMLQKGKKELPAGMEITSRFEIPKVKGHIEGNKTIINNFTQIVETLNRPMEHLLKFLLKELAVPGEVRKTSLILGSKIPALKINEKITKYTEEFVLCKECHKPDTQIIKEGEYSFLRCMACGAKHPIKSKI
jgi:translation initiation factor 2 subunit 2